MARRVIKIIGSIDSDSYREFSDSIDELTADSHKPITIELCSEGGDSYIGLAFYAKIKTCGCKITIKAYGHVMSAATIILLAGDVRVMHKDCWFMIHDDSQQLTAENGRIAMSEAKQLDALEQHWASIMARHTPLDTYTWRQMSKDTSYLTAKECLQHKIINKIFGDSHEAA